jgi:hypothetical protein
MLKFQERPLGPFKGHDRPLSFRECGDPVFDFLLGFLRGLDMGIEVPCLSAFPHPDRESEEVELSLEGIDNFRLCLVQGQLQPLQYLSQYGHRLTGFSSPAENDNIVGVPRGTGSGFQVDKVGFQGVLVLPNVVYQIVFSKNLNWPTTYGCQ